MNNAFDLIENNQENVVIKIISITRNGDEAIRHMVGHIDGVEFIYSDSVDDEMKIRNVLDGARLSTLVFLITGIESETDTQVISKIRNFTEIAHELEVLTIAIASASSPKLENKHNDLFATFLCHIDESKTANEVLLESVKSIADLLTHPDIVSCDIFFSFTPCLRLTAWHLFVLNPLSARIELRMSQRNCLIVHCWRM